MEDYKRKYSEVSERLMERNRQYQKLQGLYDSLRLRNMVVGMGERDVLSQPAHIEFNGRKSRFFFFFYLRLMPVFIVLVFWIHTFIWQWQILIKILKWIQSVFICFLSGSWISCLDSDQVEELQTLKKMLVEKRQCQRLIDCLCKWFFFYWVQQLTSVNLPCDTQGGPSMKLPRGALSSSLWDMIVRADSSPVWRLMEANPFSSLTPPPRRETRTSSRSTETRF